MTTEFTRTSLKPTSRLGRRGVLALLTAGLLFASAPLLAIDLPKAPNGYTWQRCADIKGALLVPNGWNFLRLEQDGKLAYFITEKPWQPPRPIEVGLTFNILKKVPGGSPNAFGRQYVKEMAATTGSQNTWEKDLGSFTGHGIIYSDGASQFYNLILANEVTGTAYVVTFESPLDDWQKHWTRIQPVVGKLLIDDEV